MYDGLLIAHFFGVAVGVGTPFYMRGLRRYVLTLDDPVLSREIMLNGGKYISSVGLIGLAFLIPSGILMVYVGDWGQALGGLFYAKMVFVLLLLGFVFYMRYLNTKAISGDAKALGKMKMLAPVGPVLGVSILVIAVLAFH